MKNTPPHRIKFGEGVLICVNNYELQYKERVVGTVEVEKCGMYYRIRCRFTLQGVEGIRLWAACGSRELDLGLCVQYREQQGTERYLPISRIGADRPIFYLQQDDLFVPVEETQPFGYLAQLVNAYFATRSGVKGVVVRDAKR